jgi:hypothetical protein
MSKPRNVVRVVPNKGNWSVKRNGQTISNHLKKDNAVESGKKVAKKLQPSQLVIHKENGQFQTEYTYKQDPFPPAG